MSADEPTGRDIGVGIKVLCWAGGISVVIVAAAWAVLVIVWPWATELRDVDTELRFRVGQLEKSSDERLRRIEVLERRFDRHKEGHAPGANAR